MPSEKLNIQPISSWFYNCGLGTLVPHLLVYLSPKVSSLAKFAEEPPIQLMRERFEKSQGYKLLRESFLELYVSDKEERSIIIKENKFENILSNLFETYAKATEQTIILGPVLRLTLQKILDENKNSKDKLNNFKAKLWPSFKVLVLNCLKHVQSNSNNTIENYKWQDTEKVLFVPNKKTITAIVSILKNSKNSNSSRYTYYNKAFNKASCPEFFSKKWDQVLEKSYSYLGSAEIPVFLPIEYLGELYRSFGFHLLYTYGTSSIAKPIYEYKLLAHVSDVTIINKNKNHWELICKNPKSVWAGDNLEDSDHLKKLHDSFGAKSNPIIFLELQESIQSFIGKKENILNETPRKIVKAWNVLDPLDALAYKIDEILHLKDNQKTSKLVKTSGFIDLLDSLKSYCSVEINFDAKLLKEVLKKYRNPHKRSMILRRGFKPIPEELFGIEAELGQPSFEDCGQYIGELYNSFGFDLKISTYENLDDACHFSKHSEHKVTIYKSKSSVNTIAEIHLNNHGTSWAVLELETFAMVVKNAWLNSLPQYFDDQFFLITIEKSKKISLNQTKFIKALKSRNLSLINPAFLKPKFYFVQDPKGNIPLYMSAGLCEDTDIPFIAALAKLSVAALLKIRKAHSKTKEELVDFWTPNLKKETAISRALRYKNSNWIREFHAALVAAEKESTIDWVKEKFREDIQKLKNELFTKINNIIISKEFPTSPPINN